MATAAKEQKKKHTRPARLQVEVPLSTRRAFRAKSMLDGESMSAAAKRLIDMYVNGELPQAEPKQAPQ